MTRRSQGGMGTLVRLAWFTALVACICVAGERGATGATVAIVDPAQVLATDRTNDYVGYSVQATCSEAGRFELDWVDHKRKYYGADGLLIGTIQITTVWSGSNFSSPVDASRNVYYGGYAQAKDFAPGGSVTCVRQYLIHAQVKNVMTLQVYASADKDDFDPQNVSIP